AIARHVATHPTYAISQHHPDSAHIQHMRGLYTVLAGNIKNRGTSANQPAVEGQSAKGKNTRNRVGHKFIPIFQVMKYLRTEQSEDGSVNQYIAQLCMRPDGRSEEHTSELQSRENLVCRL